MCLTVVHLCGSGWVSAWEWTTWLVWNFAVGYSRLRLPLSGVAGQRLYLLHPIGNTVKEWMFFIYIADSGRCNKSIDKHGRVIPQLSRIPKIKFYFGGVFKRPFVSLFTSVANSYTYFWKCPQAGNHFCSILWEEDSVVCFIYVCVSFEVNR